ncbi:MAG: hypothetical protein ALAOOOJD_04046 [bacterium]|nr:hypothetical protein [bacterium]
MIIFTGESLQVKKPDKDKSSNGDGTNMASSVEREFKLTFALWPLYCKQLRADRSKHLQQILNFQHMAMPLQEISALVARFTCNHNPYLAGNYNETPLRHEFDEVKIVKGRE